jgi:hypothetical protein
MGDYTEAVRLQRLAVELDPSTARWHHLLGFSYRFTRQAGRISRGFG